MLLALGWHSLLEYPLWYAYFLLPACWLAGLMLGASPQGLARADAASATAAPQASGAAATARPGLRAGLGALALAATALAGWEFWALRPLPRIPDPQAKLAAARTAALRPFYGHYAAYLVILHPNARPEPRHFRTALRQAYSVKMLWNYAQSLHRAGRTEEARYVLLRLREFIGPSHPQVAPLFKACEAPAAAEPLPPCRLDKPAGITRWTQVLP